MLKYWDSVGTAWPVWGIQVIRGKEIWGIASRLYISLARVKSWINFTLPCCYSLSSVCVIRITTVFRTPFSSWFQTLWCTQGSMTGNQVTDAGLCRLLMWCISCLDIKHVSRVSFSLWFCPWILYAVTIEILNFSEVFHNAVVSLISCCCDLVTGSWIMLNALFKVDYVPVVEIRPYTGRRLKWWTASDSAGNFDVKIASFWFGLNVRSLLGVLCQWPAGVWGRNDFLWYFVSSFKTWLKLCNLGCIVAYSSKVHLHWGQLYSYGLGVTLLIGIQLLLQLQTCLILH